MSRLQIRLLADFGLWYDGQQVAQINSTRLQSMLAYLVLNQDAPQSRQHVAFLFWPDSSETQAYTNLRNLLFKLRRALPDRDQFLRADARHLQWREDAPFSLDVAAFEQAVAQAEDTPSLQAAVDLYPGDLLPGFYDEWIGPERDRLRRRFGRSLEKLVQQLEQQRNYQLAIRYAQRLLRHDPADESAHRDLMRLRALTGDRAGALRAYHACVTMLHRELGVEPARQTRELYDRLLHEDAPPSSPAEHDVRSLAVPLLVGRDQEWQTLQSAWRTTRRRARMVLLAGEAGIGKTRLADELFEWVRRQGMVAVRTRAYAAEGSLAYAPVASWLRDNLLWEALLSLDDVWLTEVARILPELLVQRLHLPPPEPLKQDWQRLRLFEALARATLAIDRPLLLQIDDLQWCDQESLRWLHFLLRYDTRARLLVVGTVRTEDVEPEHPLVTMLADLRQSRQLDEIEVRPLPATETADLANHLAGRELSPELTSYLVRETEGNPLFVMEMIRAGLPESLDLDGALAHPLPPTVQAVIAARLARLSPAAHELVGLAAVIGRAFAFEVLAQASDAGEDTVVRALDELWHRRIVREQEGHLGDTYDFSHDKIRATAYADLGRPQRRLWHRRVAATLESLYVSNLDPFAGQIAAHFERAGQQSRAIPYYQRAALLAQQHFANEDAIQYLNKALTLLQAMPGTERPAGWQTEVSLQESLGDILHLTGRFEAALKSYQDALARIADRDRLWSSRLHLKAGNIRRSQHEYPEAQQIYQTAEQLLGSRPDETQPEWRSQWVQIQIERMWVFYWLDHWTQIVELVEKSRAIVAHYGTPRQQISFLLALASADLRRDRYLVSDETIAYVREALRVASSLGDPNQTAWVEFVLGMGLLWRDEFKEAEERMDSALSVAEESGDVVHQSRCLTYLAILQRKQGQVGRVQALVSRGRKMAKVAGMLEYVGTADANQAWIDWRSGDGDAAWVNGRAALAAWQQLPEGHASCAFKWTALWPMIDVALYQDMVNQAAAFARQLLEPSQQQLPEELTASLQAALLAEEQRQPETVVTRLRQAVTVAQRTGYL